MDAGGANRLLYSMNVERLQEVATVGKGLVIFSFLSFFLICAGLLIRGVPARAPQHSSVKEGCPSSWIIFMGTVYTLTYFTTDQYVPNLPEMGQDLSGSQGLMSATIQLNFVVKAISGIFTASLSDRIGRRPTVVMCSFLLSLASFCCGAAQRIEWFVAARILQGMGESIEPVIFAMTRDYFTSPEQRLGIVSALNIMSIGGMLLAPVVGGYVAAFSSWRVPFFGLALLWGILAIYACAKMVESCPDLSSEDNVKDAWKILDPHLMILLLTESCMMAAYLTFNANVSYMVQDIFHRTIMTTSSIMLTFGALNGLGLLLLKRILSGSILNVAKFAVLVYASSGIIASILGIFFSQFLWAYLVGCFLQASFGSMALVSVNVLFFEPLKECAGMAAASEIFAKSLLPCLYSMLSTQSLIHSGSFAFIQCQSIACMASGLVFASFAFMPPKWAALDETNYCAMTE